MSSFGSSLQLALTATAFALAIGLLFAFLASRSRIPGKRYRQWLLLLLLCLPTHGVADILGDWICRLDLLVTPAPQASAAIPEKRIAAAFELALCYFPLIALPVFWILVHADRKLLAAAEVYRAPTPVFFRIKLPMGLPYVVTGAVLVLVFCFFDYAVPHAYQLKSLSIDLLLDGGHFQNELRAMAAIMPFAAAAVAATLCSLRRIDCMKIGRGSAATSPETGRERGLGSVVRWVATATLPAAAVVGLFLLPLFASAALTEPSSEVGLAHRRTAFCFFAAVWALVLLWLSAIYLSQNTRRFLWGRGILQTLFVFGLSVVGITLISGVAGLSLMKAMYFGLLIGAIGSAAQLLAVCVDDQKPGVLFLGAPLREAALLYQPSRWQRLRRILIPLIAKRMALSAAIAVILGAAVFDGRIAIMF